MKDETVAQKMLAALGLSDKVAVPEKFKDPDKKKKVKNYEDNGIHAAEIADFRAIQGLFYFLIAPELFKPGICKHCQESFLVSRKFVAFCSYTCIEKDLERQGIKWRKGKDLEALAIDPLVYDGNEPLWVKNADRIQDVLDQLDNMRAEAELVSVPVNTPPRLPSRVNA